MRNVIGRFPAAVIGIALLSLAACSNPLQPSRATTGVADPGSQSSRAAVATDSFVAPTFTGNSINKPYIGKYFRTGKYITWAWGGCTTLAAMLDDGQTKELLLVDGYVSKAALGIGDFAYLLDDKITRVFNYAKFVAGKVAEGYRIVGWLTTHDHADHVGDIPLLMYFLDKRLGYRQNFPLIVDGQVYAAPNKPVQGLGISTPYGSVSFTAGFQNEYFKSRVTDVISFYQGASAPTPLAGTNNSVFSDRFQLFNVGAQAWESSISGGLSAKTNAALELDGLNNFALGKFRIRAFLFDHAAVPLFDMTGHRVVGYQVWHDTAPAAKKTLIMDTTDEAGFIPAGKVITTDYLFLSWAPTFCANDVLTPEIVADRKNTALAVKNHVRWTASSAIRYILPLHVDDIAANSYSPQLPADLWNVCSQPSVMRAQGLFPTFANNILNVSTVYFPYKMQSGVKLYFAVWNQRAYE